ncbi:Hsp70 family protein [Dactylosporangium sp. NPDC049140]|uniref:Hsp70 family protein n=1 Tax=Dactylosporangium sp. NPDC049140 TaxID=3155647 RepID=UPI0033E72AF9
MSVRWLVVDYGTAATVALVCGADGVVAPVRVDGREELPSAVLVNAAGYVTGADAVRRARIDSDWFRPAPKLELGRSPTAVSDAAQTLRRIAGDARPERVVLTVPASWPESRRQALADAAVAAGLPSPSLVARPVAAAAYCTLLPGREVPDGGAVLVYHLGAGGFEAAVVVRAGDAFEVVAADTNPTGGLVLDRLAADRFREALGEPAHDRRGWMLLLDNAREAREALSRQETLEPLNAGAGLLTRGELEAALRPALAATVVTARSALAAAGLGDGVPWLLTGRAAATPLVARLIGGEPLVLRHPRFAVTAGALLLAGGEPAGLAELTLDEQRTYAVGGGHVTTTWRATASTIEELRRRYRLSLPDHAEHPGDRWSRRRDERGLRHFHDVTLFPAAEPGAAGLGPAWRIPDHLPTVVREDTAVLPGPN